MATFKTKSFIESQRAKGVSDEKINKFLIEKGLDPSKEKQEIGETSFVGRLKASFGDQETKQRQDIAESLSGKKGKFDVGDIADVAGGSLPLIGGILGGAGGTVAGAGVGGVPGAGIGVAAGEGVKQTIGQLLGQRKGRTAGQELASPLVGGAVTAAGGKALQLGGRGLAKAASGTARGIRGTASKVSEKVAPSLSVKGKAGEIILGTDKQKALLAAKNNPALQEKVLRNEINVSTVGSKAQKAFEKLKTPSIAKLTRAKNKIRGKVDSNQSKERINESIKKSLGLDDFSEVADAPVTPESQRIIEKLSAFIDKNLPQKGQISRRQLAEIREKIGAQRFFKTTPPGQGNPYADSNKVVSAVKEAIKKEITNNNTVNKAYSQALKNASKDIEFFNKLGVNIFGRNKLRVGTAARKLNTLLKEIDDPQVKQELIELVKELQERSVKGKIPEGINIMEELEAIIAARPLQKDFPGISQMGETIEQLLTKPAAGIMRGRSTQPISRGANLNN